MQLIIIGNGYDLSLNLNTTFANFMLTCENKNFVVNFKKNNQKLFIKRRELSLVDGFENVTYELFSEIFKDINTWNELEIILDNVYSREFDVTTGANRYKNVEPTGKRKFLELFSEEFKLWINDINNEFLSKPGRKNSRIPYVGYNREDIVINLNFTDTIPKDYKNVHKVHYLEEYDYCYIGPQTNKMKHPMIRENLEYVLESKPENERIDNIVIYGANLHASQIVDKHIVDFILTNTSDEVPIDYINVGLKRKDLSTLKNRLKRNINYIDGSM